MANGLSGMDLSSINNYFANTPFGTYNGYQGGYGASGDFSGFDLSSLRGAVSNPNTDNQSWLSRNGGLAGVGGLLSGLGSLGLMGLQGYTGLKNISLANKQLGLAKKQFNFEKGLANRNIANQAKTINNAYDAAGQAAIGLLGGIDALTGQSINPSQETVDKANQNIKNSYVDGSPINA